jgi:hypothetical protein
VPKVLAKQCFNIRLIVNYENEQVHIGPPNFASDVRNPGGRKRLTPMRVKFIQMCVDASNSASRRDKPISRNIESSRLSSSLRKPRSSFSQERHAKKRTKSSANLPTLKCVFGIG